MLVASVILNIGGLKVEWSWKVFFITLPIMIIYSMFSRGYMNAQNVAKHGDKADYKQNPKMALFGSIGSGAIASVIITVIIGFF
mgnify:FL=1|jgi:hypothetical protein|tara:strand:+ start:276 stop:527 length:252 start_codon:yes stop_codon:yes gene_type:complete